MGHKNKLQWEILHQRVYLLRTESIALDCGSLLKETVPCLEELQNQKEPIEHGGDAAQPETRTD